ncbi:16S rRNA (guanine(966)-N(2))-methyltransferase RsmD [Usitatibacter palustris]|uniref:Ribosomal RNA small subunit methyltransferase D n=1 Tax=Usitatibacter palustris TaxID=2732487 RepID=A0A6M4H2T7_9PROT|nr:16S rRNA (guanine(966)-N(2))-methyltransferase RsmD [Usitatibacter palustris]QJR13632.1 Ribosomal RNA small subunit methyltransferase D [Usitatibacter palustris]
MTARNRVRIIGGDWRSRIVRFPDAAGLRPTPDRVRETLFNWLGQRLDGLACLDLFAGSGALGFEALSRGASRVVMVERDRATCAALRTNGTALGASNLEVIEGDGLAWLARARESFDCVFLDPPYASDLAVRSLAALPARLNPGARAYVESADALDPGAPWHLLREGRAGAVRFALYELEPSSENAHE